VLALQAGFLCAVFADVMSEKVCIGMVCMIGASVAGQFLVLGGAAAAVRRWHC